MKTQKLLLSTLFLLFGFISYAQGTLTITGQISPVTSPVSVDLVYEDNGISVSSTFMTDSTGYFYLDTIIILGSQGLVEITFDDCNGNLAGDSGFYSPNAQLGSFYDFGTIDYCPTITNETLVTGVFANAITIVNYSLSLDLGVTYQNFSTDTNGVFSESFPVLTGNYVVYLTFTDCNGVSHLDSALNNSMNATQEVFNFSNLDFCPPTAVTCQAGFSLNQNIVIDSFNNVVSTGNVMVTNNSTGSNLTHTWDFGDGSTTYTGVNFTHTYAANGPYVLCLTIDDGAGCVDTYCDSLMVNANGVLSGKTNAGFTIQMGDGSDDTSGPNAIDKLEAGSSFSIYPNPANGFLNISYEATESETAQLTIFDITGKMMLQKEFNNSSTSLRNKIDISKLNQGVYVVQFKTPSGLVTKTLSVK